MLLLLTFSRSLFTQRAGDTQVKNIVNNTEKAILVQEDGVNEDVLVSIKDLQSFDADGRVLGETKPNQTNCEKQVMIKTPSRQN
jgi:hypothetical protein